MTYKAGDQVRDEFNVPIHKLIFQKIKKTCESGKPGWIILDENKNEFTLCFIEDFDLIEKYLDFANSHMPLSREQSHSISVGIRPSKMISEHVTIEIRYRKARGKYTFIVPQCLKMWNEYCSNETLEYVKEQVKEAGEQAVKKYERKIERKTKNQ